MRGGRLCCEYLFVGFAMLALSGEAEREAHAQAPDLNIQSRVQQYTIPLLPGISQTQQLSATNYGPCLTNPVFVLVLYLFKQGLLYQKGYLQLNKSQRDEGNNSLDITNSPLVRDLQNHPADAASIIAKFFASDPQSNIDVANAIKAYLNGEDHPIQKAGVLLPEQLTPFPIGYCNPSPSLKLSAPFDPTYESNVLKSNVDNNNSAGTSIGYGGTLQVIGPAPASPGTKTFDVYGVSEQSQSVRYGAYSSKSFDALITQGAYQHFLNAFGYQSDGTPIDRINPDTPIGNIPPTNMITVDSVAFGFQDQAVFTPGYRSENVNLFTPQVTFNHQNQDLSSNGMSCWAGTLDPRQKGFCFYTDLSVTLGQTFSDVSTQSNANLALSATPGFRIPYSDWKLTIPITTTGRAYEQVAGGRDDLLLQVGPALTYAPPALYDRFGNGYAVNFSLSVTYNQNYSTLSTAAWHGYIVMPTLTVAFQPPAKLQ
jgi:hypothetical protein